MNQRELGWWSTGRGPHILRQARSQQSENVLLAHPVLVLRLATTLFCHRHPNPQESQVPRMNVTSSDSRMLNLYLPRSASCSISHPCLTDGERDFRLEKRSVHNLVKHEYQQVQRIPKYQGPNILNLTSNLLFHIYASPINICFSNHCSV